MPDSRFSPWMGVQGPRTLPVVAAVTGLAGVPVVMVPAAACAPETAVTSVSTPTSWKFTVLQIKGLVAPPPPRPPPAPSLMETPASSTPMRPPAWPAKAGTAPSEATPTLMDRATSTLRNRRDIPVPFKRKSGAQVGDAVLRPTGTTAMSLLLVQLRRLHLRRGRRTWRG